MMVCVVYNLKEAWVDSIEIIKHVFQQRMIKCDDVSIKKTWAFLAKVIVWFDVKNSSLLLGAIFNFVSDNKCQIAEG